MKKKSKCLIILTGQKFDVESMSFGPKIFAYVQEKLVLPRHIELDALIQKLADESLPMKNKIFLFQDITDNATYSLVVVETSHSLLIILVYRLFFTLIEHIFKAVLKPSDPLYIYIYAIEYLKHQIDENNFHSTALTNKVRYKDWVKKTNKSSNFIMIKKKSFKEKSKELIDYE